MGKPGRGTGTLSVFENDVSAPSCHRGGIGQAYGEPVAELFFDRVTDSAFLGIEHVQNDIHVKESTEEHSPFEHFRRLEVCRIGYHVAWVLEDVQAVPFYDLNRFLVVGIRSWNCLRAQSAQCHVVVRLAVDKRVVFLLHLLQGLIREREVGTLHLSHRKVSPMRLVEMTTDSVSEVDEKRMDTSVGHVSQDDSLVFTERQVNAELFSMGQERQSAADRHEEYKSGKKSPRRKQAGLGSQ